MKNKVFSLITFLIVFVGLSGLSFAARPVIKVDSSTVFSTAVNTANSTSGYLIIAKPVTISSNVYIKSNAYLEVVRGGMISESGTATLTINCPTSFYNDKIFSGFENGDITFGADSKIRMVYPEWWGSSGLASATTAAGSYASVVTSGTPIFVSYASYPSASVDGEVMLYSGTSGKIFKRAIGSGIAVVTSGVLSTITNNATNWNSGYTYRVVSVTGHSPISFTVNNNILSVSETKSDSVTSGYLTGTDWSTFNAKQSALGFTPISTESAHASFEPVINSGLVTQYWTGSKTWLLLNKSAVGLGNVPNVDATVASNITSNSTHRFVTDAEKITFNAKQDALSNATETVNGILTSADHKIFNAKQSALQVVTIYTNGYISSNQYKNTPTSIARIYCDNYVASGTDVSKAIFIAPYDLTVISAKGVWENNITGSTLNYLKMEVVTGATIIASKTLSNGVDITSGTVVTLTNSGIDDNLDVDDGAVISYVTTHANTGLADYKHYFEVTYKRH